MKRLLILFIVLLSLTANAEQDNFLMVDFGTSRTVAERMIRQRFGNPNAEDENSMTYYDVQLDSCVFSKVVFGFERKDYGGYYNQARFFITEPTRKKAVTHRERLAKRLSEYYPITHDYEENGNKFYKGGTSPEGIGFLFTIYTQKRDGQWSTELRYGAFHKLNVNR